MMRKAINQFPYGEAHMHIFMNGTDYKKAVADQKNGVCDRSSTRILRNTGSAESPGCGKAGISTEPQSGRWSWRLPMGSPIGRRYLPFIKRALRRHRGRSYDTMQEYCELIPGAAQAGRPFRENYDLRDHGLYAWRSDRTLTCRQ